MKALGKRDLELYGAAIAQRLDDSDESVRKAAVEAIGQLSPAALAERLPEIISYVEHTDEAVAELAGGSAHSGAAAAAEEEAAAAATRRRRHASGARAGRLRRAARTARGRRFMHALLEP